MNLLKYIISIYLLSFCTFNIFAQEAKEKKKKQEPTQIQVTITNPDGMPVQNAKVFIQEGKTIVYSDAEGIVTINLLSDDENVLIEANGYEPKTITATNIKTTSTIVLEKGDYGLSEKDEVYLPFGKQKARRVVGDVTVIDPEELATYDHRTTVFSLLRGRVPGLIGSTNINGIGGVLVIIDGLPRNNLQLITIEEVEQITVLKDAAARALYGSKADLGAVLITTKKGSPYKRRLDFNIESGIDIPISYPSYLNSADYMTYYNQARLNDGLGILYDTNAIDSTRNGLNPTKYPDVDYFTSEFLNDYKNYTRISGTASGGNEKTQFFCNASWRHSNGLINVGTGQDESNDLINLRGNVSFELNSFMKAFVEGGITFNTLKIPRLSQFGSFWQLASDYHPNYFPLKIPTNAVQDSFYLESAKLVDNSYLGGTSVYTNNIYGDLLYNGNIRYITRTVLFNTGLDFDLGFITPGLTANARLSFDLFNTIAYYQPNSYATYTPEWLVDSTGIDSLAISKEGSDVKTDELESISPGFYRRSGFYGTLNYNRTFNSIHSINANAVMYRYQYNHTSLLPEKDIHLGFRANYMYDNKYIVELTGVSTGSPAFEQGERWGITPNIAAGWIASEEAFLSSNTIIDYLKIRGSFGIINTDESFNTTDEHYLYLLRFGGAGGNFAYNMGDNSNGSSKITNLPGSSLTFEKRQEANIGFTAELLNHISLNVTYFNSTKKGILERVDYAYTAYVGNTMPFENFNSYEINGVNAGIDIFKRTGEFQFNLGSNISAIDPKWTKVDEPTFEWDYQYSEGKPTDALWGYRAIGFFRDSDDIADSPEQLLGANVQPGDIKYQDMNNDSIINENDMVVIGNSMPRFQYSLHLRVKYKFLELFALGTGQLGAESIKRSSYYWVYGNRKYSEVVEGSWTTETHETATYPRLTTLSNSNNFTNSTFWMYENNWFTLHTLQLTFTLPRSIAERMYMKNLRLYAEAGNVFTISKVKDIRELNVGFDPQYRSIQLGLKANF